jgi:hypothetical protein
MPTMHKSGKKKAARLNRAKFFPFIAQLLQSGPWIDHAVIKISVNASCSIQDKQTRNASVHLVPLLRCLSGQ